MYEYVKLLDRKYLACILCHSNYHLKSYFSVNTGTFVQCDNSECQKWRYLSDVHDPSELPAIWTCDLNPGALLKHAKFGLKQRFFLLL